MVDHFVNKKCTASKFKSLKYVDSLPIASEKSGSEF